MAPPQAQIPLAYDSVLVLPEVAPDVIDQIPATVQRWKQLCPGPLHSGKPCSDTGCTYKTSPDAGLEGCLFIYKLRAQVGTVDPNQTVALVSAMMAQLVPVIQANTRTQVDAANTIQRTVSPVLLKAMAVLWSFATSVQLLQVLIGVVAQL